jgi:hypothetical protein
MREYIIDSSLLILSIFLITLALNFSYNAIPF